MKNKTKLRVCGHLRIKKLKKESKKLE